MTTNGQTFAPIAASGRTFANALSFSGMKRLLSTLFQPKLVTPEEIERMMSAATRREEARRRVDALLR